MNNKFLKLLSTVACVLALSAGVLFADEEKKKECPCEKEKPKAANEEKKDCKKCCPSEKPKA